MKILITGICGFVGSTLARSWIETESSIVIYGIDNFSRPGSEVNRSSLQRLGIRLIHGDIRMAADLEELPAVDWVIDAAANPSVVAGIDGHNSSRQVMEHNLLGTVNVLEYCKRHRAGFIMLSSSRVYSIAALSGVPVRLEGNAYCLDFKKELPTGLSCNGVNEAFSTTPPLSLYGSAKLSSELLALEYGEAFAFPVCINRCGNMAGAGQFGRADQGIFSFWINSWLRHFPLSYFGFGGSGSQVRDFFHPRDLIQLLRKQTGADGKQQIRLVNIGGGQRNSVSLAQLSSWCEERFGPHNVSSIQEPRRFDIPWLVMDAALASKVWEWQPQISLREIFDEIAAHAEKNPDWCELAGSR